MYRTVEKDDPSGLEERIRQNLPAMKLAENMQPAASYYEYSPSAVLVPWLKRNPAILNDYWKKVDAIIDRFEDYGNVWEAYRSVPSDEKTMFDTSDEDFAKACAVYDTAMWELFDIVCSVEKDAIFLKQLEEAIIKVCPKK